ncbi:hypothetical protein SAMN04488000_103481 [Lentzea albida]|uniref:Uncharacterized protein n=1 Tax=Lentzea albida TaxID=65499 RepID=A0A1H9HCA0_9PSEU|nr:hypothetical protein SAMN04488000_103481 [Lentzea albida]
MSQPASATATRCTIGPCASPLASSRVSCAASWSPSTNWQSHNRCSSSHRSSTVASALRNSEAASRGRPADRNALARSSASRTFGQERTGTAQILPLRPIPAYAPGTTAGASISRPSMSCSTGVGCDTTRNPPAGNACR